MQVRQSQSDIQANAEGVVTLSMATYRVLPLVYSCSGCSGAAQLANTLALRLDRARLAEMSCIAGVGGGVPALLKTAQSGRRIIVLDGCHLHCAKRCLDRHTIPVDVHIDLSRAGIKKRLHEDTPDEEAQRVWSSVVLPRVAGPGWRVLAATSGNGD